MEITRSKLEELMEMEPEEVLEFGSAINIKDEFVFTKDPKWIEVHRIANELPKMSDDEYLMLKQSLINDGQFVPVYLYRGKLVDGRHRLKALLELKSNVIKCISLPNNWKISQVKVFVMGTEKRRHETKSQMAIRAYFKYKKDNSNTMSELAIEFSVDKSDISRAKKIEEKLGTEVLNKMLNDRKVYIEQYNKTYSNLKSLVTEINRREQKKHTIAKEVKPMNDAAKKGIEAVEEAHINSDLDSVHIILKKAKEIYNDLLNR